MDAMKERRLNSFAVANHSVTLGAALNLERIWRDVLEAPIPKDLQRLIRRLEQARDISSRQERSAAAPPSEDKVRSTRDT